MLLFQLVNILWHNMNVDRQVCLLVLMEQSMPLVSMPIHTAGKSHTRNIVVLIIINHIFVYFLSTFNLFCQVIFIGKHLVFNVVWKVTIKSFQSALVAVGLTKSINIANLAHYDTNDDGIAIGNWFEKDKQLCTDVYFVMPIILVKDRNDATQNGLIIKLKDVCVILWYGTNIHHCTSMRINLNHQNIWHISMQVRSMWTSLC